MKAVVIHAYGGPGVLHFHDRPDPVAREGEVLVEVAAASINPVDLMERSGQTKDYMPVSFPGILGWDLSGTVVDLGPGVHDVAIGDRVIGWAYHTYAERCAVRSDLLVRIPDDMDLVAAAALPLVTMTGSQLISDGASVTAGQTVLVSGATGGVGRAAVFTAKDRGAHVTAAVRADRLKEARELGADAVVALDDPEAMDRLEPVDVVANTVRGRTAEQLLGKVKPGGTFASATGAPANADRYPSLHIVEFVSKQRRETLRYTLQAVSDGALSIPVGLTLPLREAAFGHVAVERGGSGKVILVP